MDQGLLHIIIEIFTIMIFTSLQSFGTILNQMQVKTSVYLKAFSTLIFNAGQIIPKKQHTCRTIILPLN